MLFNLQRIKPSTNFPWWCSNYLWVDTSSQNTHAILNTNHWYIVYMDLMTSCKFGLNLLVPTQQIVYLCDSSVIFTMCRWHIEVVINRVVEYALYSKNCKKSTLNDLIVQIDVCFSGRKLNCNDRNLGKMSSNVQQNFAKDSSLRIYMRIFSLENFAKMNFDSNHWLSLFNKKRIINSNSLLPWIRKKLLFIKE